MFNHFNSIDLGFLFEKENALSGFVQKVLDSARVINGYKGFYLYSSIGEPEFEIIADTDDEKQEMELREMEAHVCGDNVWEMAVATDITDGNAHKMTRSIVFRNAETGEGLVPVGLRFSDVLPSFLPDDMIKIQIVAFAESVELFENEEDYFAVCEKDENGNAIEPGNGVIFPSGLVHNHTALPDEDEENDTGVTDLFCVLRSKIKRIEKGGMTNWWKTDDESEQTFHTFDYVTVDTLYGELELIVGASLLTEEQKKIYKEGSVIYSVITLSGDVCVDEFENGAVFNEECDLRLIRQGLVKGETDRIFSALTDDTEFEFPSENIRVSGKTGVLEELKKYQRSKERFITALSTASVVFDDGSVDFGSSRRCVAISYGNEIAEHLLFADTDENGKVSKIRIVSALGFEVRVDTPEYVYGDGLYGEDGSEELN
jgi:hypothetical protein